MNLKNPFKLEYQTQSTKFETPEPNHAASLYINSKYGVEVIDKKITRISDETDTYTVHMIHERSVNNKFIRVSFSVNKQRITRFVRHGSALAHYLDPFGIQHFW